MSYAPDSKNLLMGRGEVYFDRFLPGTSIRTGEVNLGNCSQFELSTNDETKEKFSSMSKDPVLLKSVTVKRDIQIKITGDEFSKFNMAMFLMGSESTFTQSSGTASSEVITTSAALGKWYPLAFRSVSSVVITGKTEGTDFKVDTVRGRVYIMPTGSITAGSTVTVASYSYAAITSMDQVIGGDATGIEGYMRFIGNPTAGPILEAEFWKVVLVPQGQMGLIMDDFGNWSITFKVMDDTANHASIPYYRLLQNGNN